MQMTKRKIVLVSGMSLTVVGLLAGAVIAVHGHSGQPVASSQSYGAEPGVASGQTGDPNSIALNEAGPAPSGDSGLSVTGSNASSSIGQLSGNQNKASSGSGSGGSSGASSSQTLDPSTFSQYEKYKDNQGALFGDMQVGTGDALTADHKAAVYYKGWLTNGQLFDQSRPGSDGKLVPFVFTLGAHQVIPGWEQALNGMKVGGTRLIIVPPAVGYGATGQGSIPPNAVLVFEVQLAQVQ